LVSASLEIALRRVESNRNEDERRVRVQTELGDGFIPMGRVRDRHSPNYDVEMITVERRQGQVDIGYVLDIAPGDRHTRSDRPVISLIGLD
jgi:hypothetical protein